MTARTLRVLSFLVVLGALPLGAALKTREVALGWQLIPPRPLSDAHTASSAPYPSKLPLFVCGQMGPFVQECPSGSGFFLGLSERRAFANPSTGRLFATLYVETAETRRKLKRVRLKWKKKDFEFVGSQGSIHKQKEFRLKEPVALGAGESLILHLEFKKTSPLLRRHSGVFEAAQLDFFAYE